MMLLNFWTTVGSWIACIGVGWWKGMRWVEGDGVGGRGWGGWEVGGRVYLPLVRR